MLDLFGGIIIKQSEFLGKTKVKSVSIAKDVGLAKLKEGIPLLDKKDFQVDVSSAPQLFKEICEVVKSEDETLSDGIARIEDALEKGALVLEEIFQSVLTDESAISELAEKLSLDKDIVLLLATASIRPSLEATASQMKDALEDALWSGLCCPVCGSKQAISELRTLKQNGVEGATTEGAERILHCSFSGSEWHTKRLGCTFCGNTDAVSLRYLYSESEDGYRIDVCEKCKRYIKTVDCRKISHKFIPTVEDIATLHLDVVAQEEGYKQAT